MATRCRAPPRPRHRLPRRGTFGGPSGLPRSSLLLLAAFCGRTRRGPRAHVPAAPYPNRVRSVSPFCGLTMGALSQRTSNLQPLVLEVELALQPVHQLVGDRALVAEAHDLRAL